MSRAHDLRVYVEGSAPDVERAERIIQAALTAAGLGHEAPDAPVRRQPLRLVTEQGAS